MEFPDLPEELTPPRPKASLPQLGLFILALVAAIALASAFMIPVTMALLLSLVFTPVRRFMSRRGMSSVIAATLITGTFVLVILTMMTALAVPVSDLIDDAPRMAEQIERRLEEMRQPLEDMQRTAEQIEEVANGGDDTLRAETGNGPLNTLASTAPEVFGQGVFMIVLMFFLIASGDLFYSKIVSSFSTLGDKRRAYAVVREIENALGSYLGTITLINFVLGAAIGLAMWAWGMPSPMLFAAVGFLLNFIPYIGALAGTMLAVVLALFSFENWWTILGVAATYLALTSIEGQLVTPYFVSRRLRLNTVVVFVAVAFWAWLWSVMGMVMAVPLLVVIRVLCDHIPGWEHVGNFLSAEDPVTVEADAEAAKEETRRS